MVQVDELTFEEGDTLYILEKVRILLVSFLVNMTCLRMKMDGGEQSVEERKALSHPTTVSWYSCLACVEILVFVTSS